MNKKIFILAFVIVIASMSTAFALDLNNLTGSNNNSNDTVTVDGISFKIPSGFKEVLNESVNNQKIDTPYVNYSISSKVFANGKDKIELSVTKLSNGSADDDMAKEAAINGTEAEINGVSGYEFNDPLGYGFTYVKDGKLVIITSTVKELLNEIVVA